MKKTLILLTLLLSFGTAISENNTGIIKSANNFSPSSHATKPFPSSIFTTTIGGVAILPGPGCYNAFCVPIFNNCIADGLPFWECAERKRDCRSICMGGWVL